MKLPEFLFVVVNPVMRLVLRSPLHRLCSDSIMLVRFTGRKSGRSFTTPVRYLRNHGRVYCYSSQETQWWRNLRNDATAWLTIAGREQPYTTNVIEQDPARIRAELEHYFACFPQDAAYHNVKLDQHKKPDTADLDRAVREAVVVEAKAASPDR